MKRYIVLFLLIVIDEIDAPYLPWFGAKKNVDRVRIFAKEFQDLYYKNNETLFQESSKIKVSCLNSNRNDPFNEIETPEELHFFYVGIYNIIDTSKEGCGRINQLDKDFAVRCP